MSVLTPFIRLIKIRIVLLSTLSAITGFTLATGCFSLELCIFTAGIFLLASGSGAMNQFQEYQLDSLMDRTRNRPLPKGEFSPKTGLWISMLLLFSGMLVVSLFFDIIPVGLGLITVILYNGIYTYLKRVTVFASIPGALVGAFIPAIGWTAGGGSLVSPEVMGLMLFFYLWQVPHFWLLSGIYSNDYLKAGLPSMGKFFTHRQLLRVTSTWIAATACSGMLFPLLGMFQHPVSLCFLLILVFWLGHRVFPLIKGRILFSAETVLRRAFGTINIFVIFVMVILIMDCWL